MFRWIKKLPLSIQPYHSILRIGAIATIGAISYVRIYQPRLQKLNTVGIKINELERERSELEKTLNVARSNLNVLEDFNPIVINTLKNIKPQAEEKQKNTSILQDELNNSQKDIFAFLFKARITEYVNRCDSIAKKLKNISLINKIATLVALKQYQDALKLIDDELTKQPDNIDLIRAKSFLYNAMEINFIDLINLYENALKKKNPLITENIVLIHNTAYAYSRIADNEPDIHKKQKYQDQAFALLNKAIEIDPLQVMPYFSLGFLHERMKNYKDAKDFYQKANELKPTSQSYLGLARTAFITAPNNKEYICDNLSHALKLSHNDKLTIFGQKTMRCKESEKFPDSLEDDVKQTCQQHHRAIFFNMMKQIKSIYQSASLVAGFA